MHGCADVIVRIARGDTHINVSLSAAQVFGKL